MTDDLVLDCKHHGPFNPRREVACPHCMVEVRQRLAEEQALLNLSAQRNDRLEVRLAAAEGLLKSAQFAVAIAITYSVKPEAKDHYRKMLADIDAHLAGAGNSAPAVHPSSCNCPLCIRTTQLQHVTQKIEDALNYARACAAGAGG
jgi:hypothetical protein